MPEDNEYLKSVAGVLFSKEGEKLLLYPPAKEDRIYFVPDGTKRIGNDGDYTFEYCQNLEELYIPASVEILSGIMWSSEKLKQVVFASECQIEIIDNAMFQECTALESICLPPSIQSFSDNFYGNEFLDCDNLKILYAAPGAGIYNCDYFGNQTLSGCGELIVYGEGASNALSSLAEQFNVPYQDVSSECDKVLGITFKNTVKKIVEGEKASLDTVIYPAIKKDEILTYVSSDETIAKVDQEGYVTAMATGSCYITAMSQDGTYARCQIEVEDEYTNPVFEWSEDNSSCKVTYTSQKDASKKVTYDCVVTSDIKKNATCKAKGITTYTATYGTDSDKKDVQDIAMLPHVEKTKVTPATTKENGKSVTYCSVCGKTIKRTTINKIGSVSLKDTSPVYTGKEIKPTVTVKDSSEKVIDSSNYTVAYKNNKNVGTATVTIKMKGKYSGTIQKTFTIKPKTTSVSKISAISKGFNVSWKKQSTQTTGYEIQYSTSSKFTKSTTTSIKITKNSTTSQKVTKLKSAKKYYVRVRTYKTVNSNDKSTKVYSDWSKNKSVTTKK